jgi:hypothetical protein
MAFGAYFNADIGLGRTDLYLVATCTSYAGISVVRMYAVFHSIFNPLKLKVSEYLPCRAVRKSNSSGLPNLPQGWIIELRFIYSEKNNMSITMFAKISLA